MWIWIVIGVIAVLAALVLILSYVCFFLTCYVTKKQKSFDPNEISLPKGKAYEPFWDRITSWIIAARNTPHTDVSITSFDGLTLRGRFYECFPGAPIELLMHGYRSTSERDLSGGISRCLELGRSVLIVDQRASGYSDGHVISFGINESRDCADWVRYIVENIDADAKIIISGISMGASTVLIAASMPLPENVVGVVADCGYTSARDIIKHVMRKMHLPADLLYPFVRLGGRIYGGFDLDGTSSFRSMQKCKLPVFFIHGDSDDFVPHSMSVENYKACVCKKQLVTIEGAGHGLCFPIDEQRYLTSVSDFFAPLLDKEVSSTDI